MTTSLAWALTQARAQTLALVADLPPDGVQQRTAADGKPPAWFLGHLLLADAYLLHLLLDEPLVDDFASLLERYEPPSVARADAECHTAGELVARLHQTNEARVARVSTMTVTDLAAPLRDTFLARAQPTIGHHLQSLVFHEGYHAGQLSLWRTTHGLPAVRWTLGPQ
jgi:uncharacterized damage-inducible protein DinB